jgi:hypothetical protein
VAFPEQVGAKTVEPSLDLSRLAQYIAAHLLPARLISDIRRGFEIPEQSSPLAGSTFKRGLGESGLFGFPKQQALSRSALSRSRRTRTFNDGV